MPDELIVVEDTPMRVQELARLLNLLLEAERAGARLLAAYLDELPTGTAERKVGLHAVQRDEVRNCAVLIQWPAQGRRHAEHGNRRLLSKGPRAQELARALAVPQSRPGLGGQAYRRGIAAHRAIDDEECIGGDARVAAGKHPPVRAAAGLTDVFLGAEHENPRRTYAGRMTPRIPSSSPASWPETCARSRR